MNRTKKRNKRNKVLKIVTLSLSGLLVVLLLFFGVRYLLLKKDSKDTSLVRQPDFVTQDLLVINEYSRPGRPLEQVNGIVIHYVGNPNTSAKNNRNYFNNLAVTKATYASSHYIVGLEGEIIQCVPLNEIAFASNKRNDDTISIENCHPDETGLFNEKTYASLIRLAGWLCSEYDLSEDQIIRHYDIKGKLCPLYYVEHEDAWEQMKTDIIAEKERIEAEKATLEDK